MEVIQASHEDMLNLLLDGLKDTDFSTRIAVIDGSLFYEGRVDALTKYGCRVSSGEFDVSQDSPAQIFVFKQNNERVHDIFEQVVSWIEARPGTFVIYHKDTTELPAFIEWKIEKSGWPGYLALSSLHEPATLAS